MTKITTFNPSNLNQIRAEMTAALAEVEKKFGIKIGVGKITYSENEFSAKMTTMVLNEDTSAAGSDVDPKWVSNFMRNYFSLGLSREDLGRKLTHQGRAYTIVGARSANARLPIIVRETATGQFKTFSVDLTRKSFA